MKIRAFDLAASTPWLILPEALEQILTIAGRVEDQDTIAERIEALEQRRGKPLDNTRTVEVRDGVAIIPVTGPIFRHANLFTEISGAVSTGQIATDLGRALDDPNVRAILWNIDSPGGEAKGISELAAMIWSGRERKPMAAYSGGHAASGGYWLAAAAGDVTIDDTAILGSIGVVMSYYDTRKMDEKSLVRKVEIVSSLSPYKRQDMNSDEGRASVQKIVDDLATVFVGKVAAYRGVPVEKVVTDFGRGGVKVGADAVASGMADRIGSFESTLQTTLTTLAHSPRTYSYPTGRPSMAKVVIAATTAALVTALAAGNKPEDISFEDNSESIRTQERAAGKTQLDAAVVAERTRVLSIQALGQEGFEDVVTAQINSGASEAEASLAIMKAVKDRGVTLGALRKEGQAVTHAPPAKVTEGEKEKAKAGWDKAATKVAASVRKSG
jgi:signal peptide peptidase SppA